MRSKNLCRYLMMELPSLVSFLVARIEQFRVPPVAAGGTHFYFCVEESSSAKYLYSVVLPTPSRRATSAFEIPAVTHSRVWATCSSLSTFARP